MNETVSNRISFSSFHVTSLIGLSSITLLGNLLLIYIIYINPELRTKKINIFLLNISFSDLVIGCITIPSETLFTTIKSWVLGPILCKLTVYFQILSLAASVFLLSAISVDRYKVRVILNFMD